MAGLQARTAFVVDVPVTAKVQTQSVRHSLSASAYSAWRERLILVSECLKCVLCRFLSPTMPGEMTTGRRIQFIGESRLPITNLHPALPCPALPCPALPCPALPPTPAISVHVKSVHVKSSLCNYMCHHLCANTFAMYVVLRVKSCSKHINRTCVFPCKSRLHFIICQPQEVLCHTIPLQL